ncbi:hypothetical protein PS685_01562 [Pseudomonas fluorescens]|uniref:Uncharacterized protein n=1 Tax=Pseudomonas fluorescens TaxID=294 RepID=A0A5E6YRJ4_PSEFL|nr:hypothetical protein PS685_01562 [Pseudomonas fluorescens]
MGVVRWQLHPVHHLQRLAVDRRGSKKMEITYHLFVEGFSHAS